MTPDSLKWLLEHTVSAYEAELRGADKIKERISFILSITITPFSAIALYLVNG